MDCDYKKYDPENVHNMEPLKSQSWCINTWECLYQIYYLWNGSYFDLPHVRSNYLGHYYFIVNYITRFENSLLEEPEPSLTMFVCTAHNNNFGSLNCHNRSQSDYQRDFPFENSWQRLIFFLENYSLVQLLSFLFAILIT